MRFYILLACLGFLGGVWLSSVFDLGAMTTFFLAFLALVFLPLSFFCKESRNFFLFLSLTFLASVLGISRFEISRLDSRPFLKEGKTVLVGELRGEPEERDSLTRLVFKSEKGENFLLWVPLTLDFYPGDKVRVSGVLKKVENFEAEGKEINYKDYLAVQGIRYEIKYPKVILLEKAQWWRPRVLLFSLKKSFISRLNEILPEPHSSLLAGILLGSKSGLGKEVEDNFKKAGVSHIIVLSGYNLSAVGKFLQRALAFLPISFSIWGGVIGIILFTILAGAPAAAVRAMIMSVLLLLAPLYGRVYNAGPAILAALVLMIFFNPYLLVFDLGFQLSFLATVGIIYLTPLVSNLLVKIPEKWGIRELLATTLSAQLAVAPWMLYKLGVFSIVAIPANLMILPLVPFSMFLGFFSGTIAYLGWFAALPFSFITHLLLSLILLFSNWWGSREFASVSFSYFPLSLSLFIYFLIFAYCLFNKFKLNNKKLYED